ncbi:MAG TPA: methyltransferase [Nocardioides sp.]|uniref:methyltransferase n=1 Tax=Nocardioides sp. TaxID=35761 RepID=UPI002F3FF12A
MAEAALPTAGVTETSFAGLRIRYDERVLAPRQWTVLQSRWAAELLDVLPAGRVLELCCGAGQIGLAAVATSSRELVCVDRDPAAAAYATANAAGAGLNHRVEVRQASLDAAVGASERFALVVADPPWVPSAEIGRWPEDPPGAIDGGADGLGAARRCLEVAAAHLMPGGAVLLQLGSVEQADDLSGRATEFGLQRDELRLGRRGVVARFSHAAGGRPAPARRP